MVQKPLTVARRDYMQGIVDLTNSSGLPAFVMVEVLEHTLNELRPLMGSELKRDEAAWRAAVLKETEQTDQDKKEET